MAHLGWRGGGLLSTEETQVRSSLLWHRNLFDAVAEVRRTGSLAAQGLLKDSMVKDAFFGHVFHLLRIEDWKEVSETAQNFLTNVFSGLLNTKLVEDANKFQREQEDRGNNSKSVPMKTLSEKNKPPPVKVAELAKKCYQQSYKKIPAKKVQEAVKRKKKEEAAQPRGTTSKRNQERAEPQVRQGG